MKKKSKLYLHRSRRDREPPVQRSYDAGFRSDAAYRAELPDVMDAIDPIEGAHVPIQQVGVSNFKLPLKFAVKGGEPVVLETSVTGCVSLEAHLKGINMSRIMRSFYESRDLIHTPDTLKRILAGFRRKVGGHEARVKLTFSYPIVRPSLRSGLEGFQYYQVAYEGHMDRAGKFRKFITFDFVYSSACPCSAELAEHARDTRGVYSIPHSQRSKARVSIEVDSRRKFSIEDLHRYCLEALKTETQVMVKREDEQAFAEMNGTYIKFVEDAARLIYEKLAADGRIVDFQIACAHFESLHSHDAVSVICKGVKGGFSADFTNFGSLLC